MAYAGWAGFLEMFLTRPASRATIFPVRRFTFPDRIVQTEMSSEMATAPLPKKVDDMLHAQGSSPSTLGRAASSSLNPVLVVMLVALAVYPFAVGFLPTTLQQYLGSLFR
jgi:hypothetical protein